VFTDRLLMEKFEVVAGELVVHYPGSTIQGQGASFVDAERCAIAVDRITQLEVNAMSILPVTVLTHVRTATRAD